MDRDQNFQKVSWFWDLRQRGLLDLDPPYQRRSVWTQDYRDYFIDTILLNYPAPAIFLFEETSADGKANYHVVDGKQRLTSVFDFLDGKFPVGEKAQRESLRGHWFSELSESDRRAFFSYKFSVEYIPSSDEGLISAIFDRINRNVAKLSPQELRHAKYDGFFIHMAEELTEELARAFPSDFPRIAPTSKRHMKDVEFVAEMLLYLEVGPRNHSQAELDEAFAERDKSWPKSDEVRDKFRRALGWMEAIVNNKTYELHKSRLRNQADFYALFAVICDLLDANLMPAAQTAARKLSAFVQTVDDVHARASVSSVREYYDAARSNSNDIGQRRKRIEVLSMILAGKPGPGATKAAAIQRTAPGRVTTAKRAMKRQGKPTSKAKGGR